MSGESTPGQLTMTIILSNTDAYVGEEGTITVFIDDKKSDSVKYQFKITILAEADEVEEEAEEVEAS